MITEAERISEVARRTARVLARAERAYARARRRAAGVDLSRPVTDLEFADATGMTALAIDLAAKRAVAKINKEK
jgi:hypothetical protein